MSLLDKFKYYQLVSHTSPFQHYAIHEALLEEETEEVYWVGSKPLKTYDTYQEAVEAWAKMEKLSGVMDILDADEIKHLMDRVDYSDNEEELDFE